MSLSNTEQIVTTSGNGADLSVISLILSSDLIGKSVMILLVFASIWSWAIIFNKLVQYRLVQKKMRSFEVTFWSGQGLDALYDKIKNSVDNPLASVFVSAIKECRKGEKNDEQTSSFLRIGRKDRVVTSMHLSKNSEIEHLETKISFLATVGSSAPFVGLFGTVWGIMHSFQSIAVSKNTSLAVVAPGIAEALLATAIGLFAAIPATIFYNYLASQIDKINNKIDHFIGELNSLLSRAIDEEKI